MPPISQELRDLCAAVQQARQFCDVTPGGLAYENGQFVVLFREPRFTDDEVMAASVWLGAENGRDVQVVAVPVDVPVGNKHKMHAPDDGAERIRRVRQIVQNKQFAHIDGVLVDLFTASAIIAVYDAVGEPAKRKLEKCSISRMASIAHQAISRH
jgi:hypothetical protein